MAPTQDSANAPQEMVVDLPSDSAEEASISMKGRVSNPVWSTVCAFLVLTSGLVLHPVLKLFYQEGYGDVKNTLSVLDMFAAIMILVVMLLLRNCCATSTSSLVQDEESRGRSTGNGELLLIRQANRSRPPLSWNFQRCRVLLKTTFLPGTCVFLSILLATLANYESLFLFWAFAPLEIVFVMVLARYLQPPSDRRVELQFSGRQKKVELGGVFLAVSGVVLLTGHKLWGSKKKSCLLSTDVELESADTNPPDGYLVAIVLSIVFRFNQAVSTVFIRRACVKMEDTSVLLLSLCKVDLVEPHHFEMWRDSLQPIDSAPKAVGVQVIIYKSKVGCTAI